MGLRRFHAENHQNSNQNTAQNTSRHQGFCYSLPKSKRFCSFDSPSGPSKLQTPSWEAPSGELAHFVDDWGHSPTKRGSAKPTLFFSPGSRPPPLDNMPDLHLTSSGFRLRLSHEPRAIVCPSDCRQKKQAIRLLPVFQYGGQSSPMSSQVDNFSS